MTELIHNTANLLVVRRVVDRAAPRNPPETAAPAREVPLALHVVARDGDGQPLPVRRGPGRPRKVRPAPAADEAMHDAAVRAACDRHIECDAVVRASEVRNGSLDLAWAILVAVARETAALRYEIEQRPSSRESERARSRRIDGLLGVARLRMEIRRAEAAEGEVTPHQLATLKAMLFEDIVAVARECLSEGVLRRFESELRTAFEKVGTARDPDVAEGGAASVQPEALKV